jgi:hypothetical protein
MTACWIGPLAIFPALSMTRPEVPRDMWKRWCRDSRTRRRRQGLAARVLLAFSSRGSRNGAVDFE